MEWLLVPATTQYLLWDKQTALANVTKVCLPFHSWKVKIRELSRWTGSDPSFYRSKERWPELKTQLPKDHKRLTEGGAWQVDLKFVILDMGDLGSIPRLGRSPGEGKDYPFQYSGLENSMDCVVHGVAKSWIQLSEFHFHFHYMDISLWLSICLSMDLWVFSPHFWLWWIVQLLSVTFIVMQGQSKDFLLKLGWIW